MPISEVKLMDCMEGTKAYPDKYFDLAIVDPPYGITQPAFRKESKNKAAKTSDYHHAVYLQPPPDRRYFSELVRVSKNQIVWGANYYNDYLPSGYQWIFWDKNTEATQWGDGELAFTSFTGAIKKLNFAWNGMIQGDMKNKEDRIHPTQKPVKLYKWLLTNYAKHGDKILDTHLGSGSSRIAAFNMGFDFWGFEIDPEYFAAQEKRFKEQTAQTQLFNFKESA